MNLSDEIRKQIEKNKALKLSVGEINNHLSILENLVRKDIMGQVDDAYQRGLEDGKESIHKGCVGCKYADKVVTGPPCVTCCNSYRNQWTAKKQDDEIKVGDEVEVVENGIKFFVTKIYDADGAVCGINKDGEVRYWSLSLVKRTGRHFDIPKILEEMRT